MLAKSIGAFFCTASVDPLKASGKLKAFAKTTASTFPVEIVSAILNAV